MKTLKAKIKEIWNQEWMDKQTKLLEVRNCIFEILHKQYIVNRRVETIFTRLRIGHSKLSHEHLTKSMPPVTKVMPHIHNPAHNQ